MSVSEMTANMQGMKIKDGPSRRENQATRLEGEGQAFNPVRKW
jgi:hypothetical protein